jgi:hypothetical protein
MRLRVAGRSMFGAPALPNKKNIFVSALLNVGAGYRFSKVKRLSAVAVVVAVVPQRPRRSRDFSTYFYLFVLNKLNSTYSINTLAAASATENSHRCFP